MIETQDKQLILGAGFVGLGMAQALKAANIPYDQVDASDDIGGNWHHGVYETAHIISSKTVTEFTHFPMPADYPPFPSARQLHAYLHSFADHFELKAAIELQRCVTHIHPIENNRWQVTFQNGETRIYKGVVLCNGHHWCKRFPDFKGTFTGPILHSKDYHRPSQLQGKRVLVIGGGNSACDIAAEAARVSEKAFLSLRDSVWFIPKSFAGVAVADLAQIWMPEWFQRLITHGIIRLAFGTHASYGLPQPQHRLFEKHPTLNNEVPYYLRHGRITPKPEVDYLEGDRVHFVDGSVETVDLIVCATGFHLAYPFLPPALQRVNGAMVECYGGAFLPDYKGLAFVGWGQARGGVGSLIAAYGPLFARLLQLQDQIAVPLGLVFKQIGTPLPTTHLSDPQQVFRQLYLLRWGWPWLEHRAKGIDRRIGAFANQPLLELGAIALNADPRANALR
ncbi:MAG: NAD(P)-binding domain-containing protein [Tildeniella torsiva UHER 1998/13D]|jgi:hypothetical protein|nr:NAD(P)-binding domain-containing protein [Tildeniella torsiva UHER 1998/13D]